MSQYYLLLKRMQLTFFKKIDNINNERPKIVAIKK